MITVNAYKRNTFLGKLRGLLTLKASQIIYFETRWGIHTFGMKFPIDVVILDGLHKVVKTKRNLHPNHVFLWSPQYKKVIELPSGIIDKQKIKVGEIISINFIN